MLIRKIQNVKHIDCSQVALRFQEVLSKARVKASPLNLNCESICSLKTGENCSKATMKEIFDAAKQLIYDFSLVINLLIIMHYER